MAVKKTGYLLDADVLIDHLKSVKEAEKFLKNHEGCCSVSVITRAEVLVGCGEGQLEEITAFLDSFPTLGIDKTVSDRAAQLRRQYKWKLPDAFQAAIAQVHSLNLATRNTKDFSSGLHPFVTNPYRL